MLLVCGWLVFCCEPLLGQATDPLMQLMLAQPKIEISSNVSAIASFDPPSVRPGQDATYRVVFNALEESINWPKEPPAAQGLELVAGAHGQTFQMGPGTLQPRTSFNYHVRPSKEGTFTVPEFQVKVYEQTVTIPAASIDVSEQAPTAHVQRLILDIPATNLYVGQPVKARILLPASPGGVLQLLSQAQINGDGFIVDQNSMRQRVESTPSGPNGERVTTLICETSLTPITAGRISASAQGFTTGINSGGPIIIQGPVILPGGPPRNTLLDSEPIEFEVKPLPRRGELPGFTGGVGNFAVEPPSLSTNSVQVGDTIRLSVRVRGEGNLARLVPPPAPPSKEWQIISNPDNTPPQVIQVQGYTTFSYTLVPLTEKTRATPAVPFSSFDPQRAKYLDLTFPSLPVTVKASSQSSDYKAFAAADASNPEPTEKEPVLSDVTLSPGRAVASLVPVQERSWFPLLHLTPGIAFVGLWGWDRRRRFLEQHPELVLRRRARRALHKEMRALRRAANSNDAPGFAAAVVAALRVACAPHFPAEPRALVGRDVLEVLGETESSSPSGQLVRQIFSVADASRFSAAPANAGQLLALKPQIEQLLLKLEEKL